MDELHAIEQYFGRENSVNLLTKKRFRFSCAFDKIRNYPFGTQECSLKIFFLGAVNNLTRLVPKALIDRGQTDFGQYLVEQWKVATVEDEYDVNKNKIKVTIILRRKTTSIFLVTYLPTILMNLINQATNYITGETRFDLVYTMNITCMMVLASVYLSVSASLPTTSDIKPVEVWLLFNLAYPFLVILVNVLMQVDVNHVLYKILLICII